MKCPVCREPDLTMAERQGIEIDYCPQCRGVWLDRGELDKIIERSEAASPRESAGREHRDTRDDRSYPSAHRHGEEHYGGKHSGGKHQRKRGGLLGDLFDFG